MHNNNITADVWYSRRTFVINVSQLLALKVFHIRPAARIPLGHDGSLWPLLVLSYVHSKQPILGLTQEWFRELSFSRLECGVHKLHISSADWCDLLLPLA